MNKTKIEWTDFTWNPVTGCTRGCPYCYARRMARRWGDTDFLPTFHRDRVNPPKNPASRKKPAKIFVCSMGDLFDPLVPGEWIYSVYLAMCSAPQHTYQLLTKQPGRARGENFGTNVWFGVTVNRQSQLEDAIYHLSKVEAGVRYISFEPLLEPIWIPAYASEYLDWLIVGQQTGPGAKSVDIEHAANIKRWADNYSIPVFIKNNCGWWSRYHEFPKEDR